MKKLTDEERAALLKHNLRQLKRIRARMMAAAMSRCRKDNPGAFQQREAAYAARLQRAGADCTII